MVGESERASVLKRRGGKTLVFEEYAAAVWRLPDKYRDLPMDFADGCLVRMTELHDDCVVWTTDSDFRVYQRHGRQSIPLLMP